MSDKQSVRKAAKLQGISRTTLQRWLTHTSEEEAGKGEVVTVDPGHKTVLSQEAEDSLSKYLLKSSDMYFGLTSKQVRSLAYDLSVKLNNPLNEWIRSSMAGVDWLSSFFKRHPALSVRKPQATSSARATAFNRSNVVVPSHVYNRTGEMMI
ncbi:hypothetical protein Bhyg_17432 [Pseudolycoriella hygida]|uniref:HTH CENPB-type domain-containing protein n=1 Tax=Pseudolycoriella hygida TaxID=35572 RepID=A0A9Q0RUA3_9DIPT|nr:hypothetical protein Bhyg_17432 [Pseudolycoriella hygida]